MNLETQKIKLVILYVLSAWFSVSVAQAEQICNGYIEETSPTADFTDNADGTVTHKKTGLMWKVCAEGYSGTECLNGSPPWYDWEEALTFVSGYTFAGFNDWRLPNIKELSSIVELSCYQPAINLTAFPNTPAGNYWSSSPTSYSVSMAWSVNFVNGNATYLNRNNIYTTANVRLVRTGN